MSEPAHPPLRKRLISDRHQSPSVECTHAREIDLRAEATIHFSSEDPTHPIEHLVDGSSGRDATRWASARSNTTEEIVLEFDEPQHIVRLLYEVEERDLERTQEIRLEVSCDHGRRYRQVFVQEYTFSPRGATYQCENLSFDLRDVTHLRLIVVPNKSGSGTATLSTLRLFS